MSARIAEAIDRGLDLYRRLSGEDDGLDTLGREAFIQFVDSIVRQLREAEFEADGKDRDEAFAEALAGYFGSALFAKLVAAYNLEMDVTNGLPLSNGILGRAVDHAIGDLLPYARRSIGWYSTVVAP